MDKVYKTWMAYYNILNNTIKIFKDTWQEHKIHHSTRRYIFVYSTGWRCTEPGHKTTAVLPLMDITPKGPYFQSTHPVKYLNTQTKPPLSTFLQYISNLGGWEKHILKYVTFKITENTALAEINMAQELYYMPDGKADYGIGYFRWLIATDTEILIEGNV
eukprot:10096862-Ditylum_brightwellii.AAC.1